MADKVLKIVKVFLASPGGLEEERRIASRIVDEINTSHSEKWGVQIKLVGWELTLPGYARAQSLINRDLDECEYFIGMLYRLWGSATADVDGKYTSGFEEEYNRSVSHLNSGRMKDIQLFFKRISAEHLADPGPSLEKVLSFRSECIENRKPLFKEFEGQADFERIIRQAIEHIGWNETSVARPSDAPKLPAADIGLQTESAAGLLSSPAAMFISGLLKRSGGWDDTHAHEIARLRLIALGLIRSGNDDRRLGVHDANLIFSQRHSIDLGPDEIGSLVDAGVAHFHNQNSPIWHWIANNSIDAFDRIRISANFENDTYCANAFLILRKCGQPLPFFSSDPPKPEDRIINFRRWLTKKNDSAFQAAANHIGEQGDTTDAKLLTELRAEVSSTRVNSVNLVVAKLLQKSSALKTLQFIAEANCDPIPASLLDSLFEHPASLPTEVLQKCLSATNGKLRLKAAAILAKRQDIDLEQAGRLIQDSDLDVRLIGIEALGKLGQSLDQDSVRKALTIKTASGGFLRLGLISEAARKDQDAAFNKFKIDELSKLPRKELKLRVSRSVDLHDCELEALFRNHTRQEVSDIRKHLDNRFTDYFEEKIKWIEQVVGADEALLAKIKGLEVPLKRRLSSMAMAALASLGDKLDLRRIRHAVDSEEVEIEESVIAYLGRHGDWSDCKRVIDACDRHQSNQLNIFGPPSPLIKPAAAVLYKLGKGNLADLLSTTMSPALRNNVIVLLAKKDIIAINDIELLAMLDITSDQARSIVAIKCARYLSKTRLTEILAKYVGRNTTYFYNVVHWLDLGISMPSSVRLRVTSAELEEMLF